MNLITSVLSFFVAIGVLVVIHEMGHYSVARLAGVKVLRFSIGFGKPLYQHRARNGTEWSIGWLPLGGYVKMLDERETEALGGPPIAPEDLPRAFNRQSVGKRFAIVAAGPIANFLLAIFLFSAMYVHGVAEPSAIIMTPQDGTPAANAGMYSGERITGIRRHDDGSVVPVRSWVDLQWKLADAAEGERSLTLLTRQEGGGRDEHALTLPAAVRAGGQESDDGLAMQLGLMPGGGKARVSALLPNSPAGRAGLLPGDIILQLNGQRIDDARALVERLQGMAGHPSQLTIDRDGQQRTLNVTPEAATDAASGKQVGRIGAGIASQTPSVNVSYGPIDAVALGARRTWDISAYSVKMFGRMLVGEASLKNLSGPVTIADYAGRSARMGLEAFLSFLALVSISLGVLNLLPIPVLDGGHLLYYAVEAVTGRTLSERWQSIMQRAGLFCIVALSVVALFNDLTRLIHS
jgi:regulator of sigma E protease